MSRYSIALLSLVAFIAFLIIGYFAVMMIFVAYMEISGTHDQDGGGAMAVGLVIAPICALVISAIATPLAMMWLNRRQNRSTNPTPAQSARDRKLLFVALGMIGGLILGNYLANAFQMYLGNMIYDSRIAFWLFEHAHKLLMSTLAVAGIVAGLRIDRYRNKQPAEESIDKEPV